MIQATKDRFIYEMQKKKKNARAYKKIGQIMLEAPYADLKVVRPTIE